MNNQQILDHCVNYFYERYKQQRWTGGWGSGSDPDNRCALGSMITDICDDDVDICYQWKRLFGYNPVFNKLTNNIMELNDLLAITPQFGVEWSFIEYKLNEYANKSNLIYNTPMMKENKPVPKKLNEPVREEESEEEFEPECDVI